MASSYDYNFSVNGTEKQFISGLIDYLTGLSPKITCSSNVDTEFPDSDLTHVPEFNFSIDNSLTFSLRRGSTSGDAPLSTNTSKYKATCGTTSIDIDFCGNSSQSYTATVPRFYLISNIVGPNFVYISINTTQRGGDNQPLNNNLSIAYCSDSTKHYALNIDINRRTKTTMFDMSDRTFKEVSGSAYGTFLSRFSYACPPGYIDYIKSSIYQYSNTKSFESTSIYDCSTVAIGDTVSLKDGPYLAVGTNQLVKV